MKERKRDINSYDPKSPTNPRYNEEAAQPVRLVERGHDAEELEDGFKDWNAQLAADGRLIPDIARV